MTKRSPSNIQSHDLLGDSSERDPPVPIPNTAVKPLSPDCTARASVWESRKLPGLNTKASEKSEAFLFARPPLAYMVR